MRFSASLLSALALSAASFAQGASLAATKRQIVVSEHGTTVAPADGSTITPGAIFPFTYENRNFCESGYSPIQVYLSASPPTSGDITTDGGLAAGSFLFAFGEYLIPNFGSLHLPPRTPCGGAHMATHPFRSPADELATAAADFPDRPNA